MRAAPNSWLYGTSAESFDGVDNRSIHVDPEVIDSSASPRCAAVAGFSLHANVAIPARDRLRLERLLKYAARPPLSMDRLEALPDGRLRYWFKTRWRDGTTLAISNRWSFSRNSRH